MLIFRGQMEKHGFRGKRKENIEMGFCLMRTAVRQTKLSKKELAQLPKWLRLFPAALKKATAEDPQDSEEQSLSPLGIFATAKEAWAVKGEGGLFPDNPLIVVVWQNDSLLRPRQNLPVFISHGRKQEDEEAKNQLLRAGIPFLEEQVEAQAPPTVRFGGQSFPGLEGIQNFIALWNRQVKEKGQPEVNAC